MDAPLVDETARFFLWDTVLRLAGVVEIALGYGAFVLLLYCRLLIPGGADVWHWLEPGPLWALVFAPLFLLDWRNFLHWKYLRTHRERFSSQDGRRYLLICISESLFKILLCVHLMFRRVRPYLSFKLVMFPYAFGYVLHFVLGHFVPLEDADRAEGCNMVAAVFSDLVRFLWFILLISLSLKIESSGKGMKDSYDWQAAFWPCWGMEGIILLVAALLLPICLASTLADRRRVLMLTWLILSLVSFGIAAFVSGYNIVQVLDDNLCPEVPCSSAAQQTHCADCNGKLQLVFGPWLAFLPTFAVCTMVFRRRLAITLHEAWYQPPPVGPESGAAAATSAARTDLPPPAVLFRVTATYYSRTCEAATLDAERSDLGSLDYRQATFQSTHSLSRVSLDPSTSILSARGATLVDIVESEQLCFICFSEPPDAVLLECGHAGLCSACAEHIMQRRPGAQCPICRSAITMVVRLRADLPLPSSLFRCDRQLPAAAPAAAAAAAPSITLRAEDPEGGVVDLGVEAAQGPPWPSAAKRHAVMVELMSSRSRVDFRWWQS